MKIEALHVGMKIKHPQYGVGVVKNIAEHTAEVLFDEGKRILDPEGSGIEAAEAHAAISGLEVPLKVFVDQIVSSVISGLGLEKSDEEIKGLGSRWHGGKMMLHPADPALQAKEVPLEVFFHKIVMMRNNLRTLEMKINAQEKLTDAEKVEFQQYITRCYGSMTTFNILFKEREDGFNT
jgi:hypothetical protein